jgi:lipid-A-disaccharide synthase
MEREVYAEAGADVSFVGHPLLDMVSVEAEPEELRKEFKLSDSERLIGLFPGSRRGEIESLLPEMLKAASELKKEKDDLKFLVSAADGIKEEYLQSFVDQSQIKAQIIGESNYKIMKAAEFIITASGTTALESAILNTPQIICYQAAWTSYFLAKYVFKIEFVGLPNIIYGSQIVPELLQNDFEAAKIVEIALEWLNDQNQLNKIKNKLQIVREKLGGGGAVNKTAELLLKEGGLKNSG